MWGRYILKLDKLNKGSRKWGDILKSINAIINRRKDKKLEELIKINAEAFLGIIIIGIFFKVFLS